MKNFQKLLENPNRLLCDPVSIFLIFAVILVAAATSSNNTAMSKINQHDQCVAYWTNRTAGWRNPPTIEYIQKDNSFCGQIA